MTPPGERAVVWLVATGRRPCELGDVDVLLITGGTAGPEIEASDAGFDAVRRAVTAWASAAATVRPVTDSLIWVDEHGLRNGDLDREEHRVVGWPIALAAGVVRQLHLAALWQAATEGPVRLVTFLADSGIPVLPVE